MIRFLFLALIVSTATSLRAEQPIKCNTNGNQLELNTCAADDFKRADKELNETYQALIKKEVKYQVFISKLRAAQRAWVAFRDAELDAAFACEKADARICWGSMYPMRFSAYKTTLTQERTKRLKQLLQEGQSKNK